MVPTFIRRASVLAAGGLLLAGCSGYNRDIAWLQYHQEPEQADDQTDLVDGTYKGLVRADQATGLGCPQNTEGTVEIGDHTLYFAYSPSVFFISFVQPDGTIKGTAGDTMLEGRTENGFLLFTVSSPECRISYRFRYVV